MPTQMILHGTFFLLVILQFSYYISTIRHFTYIRDSDYKGKAHDFELDFLIAVKNEENNLEDLVNSVLKQLVFSQSNRVRILFVDDHSTDGTVSILRDLKHKYPDIIFHLSLPDLEHGKKAAIRLGMNHVRKFALLLDADCRPEGPLWASRMIEAITSADVALGYAPFFKEKSILNRLIRFECMWIAAQYFGFSQKGRPYMGVGRNMAIRGDGFHQVQHLVKGENLLSGDDDLFVQAASGVLRFANVTNETAFVYSKAEDNYPSFLRQKRRQITTSTRYGLHHQLPLFIDSATKILWPILLFAIWLNMNILWSLVYSCVFVIVQYAIHYTMSRKLLEKDLSAFIPVLVLLYGIHLAILALYSLIRRDKKWK